jgi:hypothetical protein
MAAHPFHDGAEIDLLDLGLDAELLCFPDFNDSIRRIDEDFGRDSAHVEARAAHRPLVHDRQALLVGQNILKEVRACSGADDDHVVFFHERCPFVIFL